MASNTNIEALVVDALIERPKTFEAGGRVFQLFPMTLGKSYMIAALVKQLDADQELLAVAPEYECMRVASEHRAIVSLIIAYSVCKGPAELFNKLHVEELQEFFENEINTPARATLLSYILTADHYKQILEFYGIDKEFDKLKKIEAVKKASTNVTLCGKSPWGSLIDFACERYGWTVDYVLWGVSHTTLQMLMADNTRTVFLSDDEYKKAFGARPGDDVIDANHITAAEAMAALNIKITHE